MNICICRLCANNNHTNMLKASSKNVTLLQKNTKILNFNPKMQLVQTCIISHPHYILYDGNGFMGLPFLFSLQSLSLRMRYPNFNASYILSAVVVCCTTLTFLIGLPFQFFLFTASLTCGGEVEWLTNQHIVQ